MAGMAGEFMSNCESKYFRDRIVAQLAGAKDNCVPDPHSEDPMEQFIAQNSPQQLEEFIFNNSKGSREEYLSLTAEMLLAVRQCRGKPGQGREQLNGADHEVPSGATANGQHSEEEQAAS
ncbi:uncharacterized protein LOC143302216 [Babylonia areolata]|uniref:uncharacterized protein LOC143302216 n=1 Tax=Babylonia areolata TaxID=304850 RepID=UPI003FD418A1